LNQNPLVTIRCITYNHAPYICDAIEGFLMQNTSFPFEILIHDDASTDGTAEIVKKYESKYPHLIKAVYQKENQYSKGIRVAQYLSPLIKGKYIALCEGDDYWTDPKKLEKQVKILEERAELDMCIHSAISIETKTGLKELIGNFADYETVISVEKIIERRPAIIPTAAILIRSEVSIETDKFFELNPGQTVGDIFIQFFGGLRGGAFFLNQPMSVYRKFVPGSFNERFEIDRNLRKRHVITRLNAYNYLNSFTHGKYKNSFIKSGSYDIMNYLINFGNPRKERALVFFKNIRWLNLNQIIISIILLSIPFAGYKLIKSIFSKINLVNWIK